MPVPIWPAPITPTVLISAIAPSPGDSAEAVPRACGFTQAAPVRPSALLQCSEGCRAVNMNSVSCEASYLAIVATWRYRDHRRLGGGMPDGIDVQLKKGVLELCVLALLSRGDAYGYEIASRLAETIEMAEGTVYPLMRRMQSDGLRSE